MIRINTLLKFLYNFLGWFDRYLEPPCLKFVSVTTVSVAICFGAIIVMTSQRDMTPLGKPVGGDYSAFYIAGKILHTHSPEQVYNISLQNQLYHDQFSDMPNDVFLPYAYSPFLTFIFYPLAQLPFIFSYLIWLLVSLFLYVAGLLFLRRNNSFLDKESWLIAFLLSLSFEPFIMETWLGGQVSSLGFFIISLVIYLDLLRKHFSAGIILSLCLYKPTLLFLIIPMLVLMRRFAILGGFLIGSIGLMGICTIVLGWETIFNYGILLLGFAKAKTSPEAVFQIWKYVDMASFSRLLFSNPPSMGWIILLFLSLGSLFCFTLLRLELDREDRWKQLVWAITLSWTLFLNIYVGIYDSILVVISCFLTFMVLYQHPFLNLTHIPPTFKIILSFLYLIPWFSQHLAQQTGVQIFSIILLALGMYQIYLAQIIRHHPLPNLSLPTSSSVFYPPNKVKDQRGLSSYHTKPLI